MMFVQKRFSHPLTHFVVSVILDAADIDDNNADNGALIMYKVSQGHSTFSFSFSVDFN